MITQKEFQMEQAIKKWNMFFTTLFAILVGIFLGTLHRGDWYFVQLLGVTEIVVVTLAIARLVRLFCYDNITLFVREAFLDVRTVKQVEGGVEHYERVPSENSFKRTLSKLLNCPWCIGVWIALGVFWLYRDFPIVYFVYLILAVAQLASMLLVFSNLVGWNAEYKKIQSEKIQ